MVVSNAGQLLRNSNRRNNGQESVGSERDSSAASTKLRGIIKLREELNDVSKNNQSVSIDEESNYNS